MLSRKQKRAEPPATVLLVEPRAADLERTRVQLSEADFRVVPVTRFDAAVPLFEAIHPEAVVLAAQGPDYVALAVARRLRQLCRGTTPILYLVDAQDADTQRHCLEKGLGMDVAPRSDSGLELVMRLHSQLQFKNAVRRALLPEEASGAETLRDPLTGLHNRAFLLEMLGLETRRMERFGGCFSLVVGALEDYRALRKESGRAIAERLLLYSSVVLGQTVREADLVARVGEEEFAVLLPGTPAESVPDVLARLGERFSLARLQVEGRVLRPMLSLGAVSYPDQVGSPALLLGAALQSVRRAREERRSAGMGLTL